MKTIFLTMDLEEWYHLDYLKSYRLSNSPIQVIPKIIDFLDLLDEIQIKATFFVVGEIAERNADIIRELVDRGHAIGCHGMEHELLYNKDNKSYREEIQKAKILLEKISGVSVEGYRASCFSMERDKLEITREVGYQYDSSSISFKQHPLYRNLDLTGFEKVDDLVYREEEFFEYMIPTLEIGKYSLPISGGGYLRLFPYWLMRYFIRQYEKQHHQFLLYIHPFEVTNIKLPLPKGLDIKTRFRALVGRRGNLNKLRKLLIGMKREGAVFRTIKEDIEVRKVST